VIRERLLVLRERRATLVAQSDSQRTEVFALVERLDRATAWIGRAKAMALKLRTHPVWLAAGVALLVAVRPRRMLKLAATGFSLWRAWRNVSAMIDRYVPSRPVARRATSL